MTTAQRRANNDKIRNLVLTLDTRDLGYFLTYATGLIKCRAKHETIPAASEVLAKAAAKLEESADLIIDGYWNETLTR